MRHYSARQRVADGKFIYCCGDLATGYCDDYEFTLKAYQQYDPAGVPNLEANKDKFHGPDHGHATKEEACDCYRQYLLDFRMRLGKDENQMHRCAECKEFTQNVLQIGAYSILILCDAHNNEETIKKHFKVNESWES